MALKNLLSVLQHGLIAELQVELETSTKKYQAYIIALIKKKKDQTKLHVCVKLNLFLKHVLPLLPHLLHQQWKIWDPVSCLQLLQRCV